LRHTSLQTNRVGALKAHFLFLGQCPRLPPTLLNITDSI